MRKEITKLNPQLVTTIVKTTIGHYQNLFAMRYPFSKLDHVMCPDYKYGGMENAGCITYAEIYMCNKKDMNVPERTYFSLTL
jgi:aminopeptidase N